jgi:hypothetical protein
MRRMSRLGFQVAFRAIALMGLVLLAGCGRPSAQDYAAFENRLLAEGLLRTDTAPQDAPYGTEDLIRNFERIALYREKDAVRPSGDGNQERSPIKRWYGPLRYTFLGNAVTQADRAETALLMRRIAAVTGLEISESESDPSFWILITTPEERDAVRDQLTRLNPGLANALDYWRENRQVICVTENMVLSADRNRLAGAVAVIAAETSGVLRRACLHEEIVQSLGLGNDHPEVRPSIFNDDGEFALLTEHDEHLLRILYNPRLQPGMSAAEAMPIVRQIVAGISLGEENARLARTSD